MKIELVAENVVCNDINITIFSVLVQCTQVNMMLVMLL